MDRATTELVKELRALAHPSAEAMADGARITALVKLADRAADRLIVLEGSNKGLVLQNSMLRERPDLPADRIPAARSYQQEIARLRDEIDRMQTTRKVLWGMLQRAAEQLNAIRKVLK
jgi:hypothetical protein